MERSIDQVIIRIVHYEKNNQYYKASSSYVNTAFDIKGSGIQLADYSIKSTNNSTYKLRNWIIEISNDQENQTKIDEVRNNLNQNESNKFDTFSVIQQNEFYRFVGLRETDSIWNNNYYNYIISNSKT